MLPFRTILLPVDYSDSSHAMIPYARDLALHFSSQLTLLHAYGYSTPPGHETGLFDPHWPEQARAFEKKRIEEFARNAFPELHTDALAHEGEPAGVIHDFIQHQGTDLVMLPTKGSGPLRRMLIGSVTAKVLHDVSAAVWTVTEHALASRPALLPCHAVVCALHDGPEADAVLLAAKFLSQSFGAELYLVRSVPVPPAAAEIDFSKIRLELLHAAETEVTALKAKLGVDAPHKVTDRYIVEAVHELALEKKAGLVVLGRGQVQATFGRLWSQLYPIVREAPCPVLSI